MINWKTYKTLTKEQKEEYNFRFKDKPFTVDGRGISLCTIFMFMSLSLFMFTIYLTVTDERFANIKIDVLKLLNAAADVTRLTLIIIIALAIGFIIELIYKTYTEYKWKKDNKVKKI